MAEEANGMRPRLQPSANITKSCAQAVDFRAFHALPVTSFTASVLGVWFLILSLVVIRTRRAKAIAYGRVRCREGFLGRLMLCLAAARRQQPTFARACRRDGGDKLMGRRIRAHGNFAEYTPMFLLTLFIAEASPARAVILQLARSPVPL